MAAERQDQDEQMVDDEPVMLEEGEGEEIAPDEDAAMDSDEGEDDLMEGEIQLQNDSVAHFDSHTDSIFCIAQHPTRPNIVATGAGDDLAYVFSRPTPSPADIEQQKKSASAQTPRESIPPLSKLDGHKDSINAITFTQPSGEFLLTAGLDGQIRAWRDGSSGHDGTSWSLLAHVREVDEINFVAASPHPDHPNTFALGASDGSVWVYTVDASDSQSPLQIVQAFYLHTAPCTAGAWSPDGALLATVSEEGSLYVWDVFGEAAAAGISTSGGSQAVVGLTADDERFRVDGGLYSVAISPNGALVAVGGAEGMIRIVGLPRLAGSASATAGAKGGAGAKAKAGGSKQQGGPKGGDASAGQAGQILAAMQVQSDGVETLAFSPDASLLVLASGSVDGSIVFYDAARSFAVRQHVKEAHEEHAVIKVEFAGRGESLRLTSSGNDGVVRRWNARGEHKLLGEYKGHRGGGDGGGVLGFVQGGEDGRYVVTAGDE